MEKPIPRKMMGGGKMEKPIPRKMMKGKDGKAHPSEGSGTKAWKTRKMIDLNQKHDQNNL